MKYAQNNRPAGYHKFPKVRFNFTKLDSRTIARWVLWIIAAGVLLTAFLFIIYSKDLPDPNKLTAREIPQSTKIYARDGTTLLYEIHGEVKRTLIPFSEMNDNIKHATIAIEDKNFYNESGISVTGIIRSTLIDLFHFHLKQGASTITQQFVKNAVLTKQKSLSRKIKEIILSIELNSRYKKDDILKLYLNEIPYGRNAYGIEAASQAYYGIHAKDLDLAQAAYLAALPQSPSYYSPSGSHRSDLDARKNLVLDQMLAQGYINQNQHDQAKGETVAFVKPSQQITAPHFVFYVEDYLAQKYSEQTLETGGLKVTTTLDPNLQKIAEQVVADGAATNSKKYNANNAALVAIDPKTGQILAMVGSKNYYGSPEPAGCKPGINCTFEPDVNVATSQRQPGSSGKPYVYATAFKQQFAMSPATMLMDVVTDFGTYGGKAYEPHNYNGNQYGPVSIRQALAGSLNIPAVKTLDLVGVNNAVQTMHDFGITSPLQNCGLSLVLGGCEVTLLDHVSGYSTFAAGGTHHPETGILKVEDSSGNILEQFQDQPKQVLDPQAAYEITNILSDNGARAFIFGSNSPLILPDRPVAAKTGTTQNFHDGWTLGYTPSLAAGVWVGNNDGELVKRGADGVVIAGPIWHNFMLQATKTMPVETFSAPQGIQHVTVDSVSGKLPNPYTPTTKTEVFASYAVPKDADNVHVVYAVPANEADTSNTNNQNNNNANPNTNSSGGSNTSSGPTVNKLFTILHSERPTYPNWENPVQAWATAHGYVYPPADAVPVNDSAQPVQGTGSGSGSGGSQAPTGNPPQVNIFSPADKSVVTSAPFVIQATIIPDPNNKITRVDFLVDGTTTQSTTNQPYNFAVNQLLPSGDHTFAIHAVDDKGNTGDTSITLKFK